MLLNEIFAQLADGELSQTHLNAIDTTPKISQVVNHLNLGLADLFKRFFLREGRLMVQLLENQYLYPLDLYHAVSNTDSAVPLDKRFILDSPGALFANDLLKIEKVLTPAGFALALDDGHDKWALTTTDTKPPTLRVPAGIINQSLELPDELKTTQLEVVYRARHPKIDVGAPGFSAAAYEVMIPDSHLQALLYYVASRVLAPLGMGQAEGITSTNYWKRYELECASLTNAGLRLQQIEGHDKLRDRGFA
jgi:hypothetical protein